MSDKTSRRGFLKFLGKGGAVGAALAVPGSSYAIGVDAATKGEPRTELAFNFTCACSRSLIAAVPEKVGTVVDVPCDCGREWHMRWEGDHFQTFDQTTVERSTQTGGVSGHKRSPSAWNLRRK